MLLYTIKIRQYLVVELQQVCRKVHVSAKTYFKNIALGGRGRGEWEVFIFG